jgi:hypothetical protein
MRAALGLAVATVFALSLWAWWFYFRTIAIRDPCNAFVTNTAPTVSPRLLLTERGLALAVHYSPSKDTEADSIAAALSRRPRALRISSTGRKLAGLGSTADGEMLIAIASAEEARAVLSELCFRQTDSINLMEPLPAGT